MKIEKDRKRATIYNSCSSLSSFFVFLPSFFFFDFARDTIPKLANRAK